MLLCSLKAIHITGTYGGSMQPRWATIVGPSSKMTFNRFQGMIEKDIFYKNHQNKEKGWCRWVHSWMGRIDISSPWIIRREITSNLYVSIKTLHKGRITNA